MAGDRILICSFKCFHLIIAISSSFSSWDKSFSFFTHKVYIYTHNTHIPLYSIYIQKPSVKTISLKSLRSAGLWACVRATSFTQTPLGQGEQQNMLAAEFPCEQPGNAQEEVSQSPCCRHLISQSKVLAISKLSTSKQLRNLKSCLD